MIPDLPDEGDSFGSRLRVARRRLRTAGGSRWGQGDLADAVGVERNTVSRWENANVRPRDPATVAKLARVLNVSAEWLLDGFGPAGAAPAGGRTELRDGRDARAYPASASGLPAAVRTLIGGYLDRLTDVGCAPARIAGAEALLLAGARNEVSAIPLAERSEADVAADVDAAWDVVVRILRREGIRP